MRAPSKNTLETPEASEGKPCCFVPYTARRAGPKTLMRAAFTLIGTRHVRHKQKIRSEPRGASSWTSLNRS